MLSKGAPMLIDGTVTEGDGMVRQATSVEEETSGFVARWPANRVAYERNEEFIELGIDLGGEPKKHMSGDVGRRKLIEAKVLARLSLLKRFAAPSFMYGS